MNALRGQATYNRAQEDARMAAAFTWSDIEITSSKRLRAALIKKHGSLTIAAYTLQVNFQRLSDTIWGRRYPINTISAIQQDLNLTNQQVLQLWPLLKTWPRERRQ
jgi:hypothetical protein